MKCQKTACPYYLRQNKFCIMRNKLLLVLAIYISTISFTQAQAPATYNSADIYMQLKKLNVLGSVLYIAAHPDDENTRLLAYLAKEKQFRTGYLSLTRGDGGQNLIGDEQGIELGLIRTQELLAARRIDGAEQFFSRAYDFGYSKNATEALKIWGHDKILSDVVQIIRKFQPDVIITRFPGDARAGHGHHWASNLLANEAFKVAGDSTWAVFTHFDSTFFQKIANGSDAVFTDSTNETGVIAGAPWQAKRILWNTFNFGNTNTTSNDQFKMEVGTFNPLIGKGYGEIASESRSQHKSQGFGIPRQRGLATEYFVTTGGEAPATDLMDDINTTWSRIEGGAKVEPLVNDVIAHYNFEHPENSVNDLVKLYKVINGLPGGYWQARKLEEVKNLILACSGFFAEATTSSEYAVTGDSIKVNFLVNNQNGGLVQLNKIVYNGFDSSFNITLTNNTNIGFVKPFLVPQAFEITQPYWLARPMEKGGSFNVKDPLLIGNAQNNPVLSVVYNITVNGLALTVTRPVQAKYSDPVKGELYQPLVVIPPVIVSSSPTVALTNIKPGNAFTANPEMDIKYKTNFTASKTAVTVRVFQDASAVYVKDTTIDAETGKEFDLKIPVKQIFTKDIGSNLLSAELHVQQNGHSYKYTHYLRSIQYDHIPHINYFYRDNVKVVDDEIKTVGKKVGYIAGAGDKVPQALVQMGYDVKMLAAADITTDNLKQYDAIVTGVRAYDVNTFLTEKYDVLMQYINNGGNLIVQYNRSNLIGTGQIKVGPYPFSVTNSRVTDETADVHVLLPEHPVLNYPNKITPKDFEGWIQERSIYHVGNGDARYEAPIAMHDPNEQESSGSLIIAKYGKGNFVYTGIVFFRELPAGVSGAYRLMANLIALPKNTK